MQIRLRGAVARSPRKIVPSTGPVRPSCGGSPPRDGQRQRWRSQWVREREPPSPALASRHHRDRLADGIASGARQPSTTTAGSAHRQRHRVTIASARARVITATSTADLSAATDERQAARTGAAPPGHQSPALGHHTSTSTRPGATVARHGQRHGFSKVLRFRRYHSGACAFSVAIGVSQAHWACLVQHASQNNHPLMKGERDARARTRLGACSIRVVHRLSRPRWLHLAKRRFQVSDWGGQQRALPASS